MKLKTFTLAVVAITGFAGLCQAQLLSDNFTADSGLNTNLWTDQSSLLVSLALAPGAALLPPVLGFGPSGMQMSGINGTNEFAGLQSLATFAPPFTLNTTVEGMAAYGYPFQVFLVNSNLTQWFFIGGNVGSYNGVYYGIWANYTASGGPVGYRGEELYYQPDPDVWYCFGFPWRRTGTRPSCSQPMASSWRLRVVCRLAPDHFTSSWPNGKACLLLLDPTWRSGSRST